MLTSPLSAIKLHRETLLDVPGLYHQSADGTANGVQGQLSWISPTRSILDEW